MTVTVENLTKKYRSGGSAIVAVEDLSFEASQGELFTLLGPSGCGKTTTLRSIAGLERIEGGQISIDGETVATTDRSVKPEQRDIGLMFQSYALWPHMTARENIMYALKARDWPRGDRHDRIDEVLELVSLPEMGDRYPSELSGGQQQRIAFARAVSYEPSVLLMDEPLSNLDFKQRRRMRRLLLEMLEEVGITTIYVTHDQEEAFEISDETLVLDQGEKAQQGTPQELYESPRTPFVADFLGEANLLPASVVQTEPGSDRVKCTVSEGTTSIEVTGRCVDRSVPNDPTVVVRPEDVHPDARADGSADVREINRWSGTLSHQYYRGSFTQNEVEIGDITIQVKTDRPVLEEGESVTVTVDPADALLVSSD